MHVRLIFLIVAGVHCLNRYKIDLIKNFINENKAKACIFLVDWKKHDRVLVQKHIQKDFNIPTAFFIREASTASDYNEHKFGKVAYIVDVPPEEKDFLYELTKREKFRIVYIWLFITEINIKNELANYFFGIGKRVDMDVRVAVKYSGKIYKLFEVYYKESELVVESMGIFKEGKFITSQRNASMYETRKNLTAVTLRSGNTVHYHHEAPNYENELRHKGVPFEKFDFVLFMILKQIHGFDFNITLRSAWFGNTSSGIDSGVANLLHEKKIDIAGCGGILRVDRIDYYDFLMPYYRFRTSFFFRNPGTVKPGAEVLKPFSAKTWYAVMVSAFVMSSAIKFAYWIDYRYLRFSGKYSFFTSIVITVSTFAQQGSAIFPHNLGGRIIYLNLLIMSILLYNYYTSSLVSSLLSTKPSVFCTIKELEESKIKIGLENQPYTTTYIIQQRKNIYIQLLNSSKIYEGGMPNYLTPEEGVARVKKGGFAYHTEVTTVYPIIAKTFEQNLICDLAEINFVLPGEIGLILPKRSQYKELFQISLVKMRQSGIHKREHNIWVAKKPECLLSSRVVSVGINELFLVYMIVLFGYILSLLVLVLEIACSKMA